MTRLQYVRTTNKLKREIEITRQEIEAMRDTMPAERFKTFESYMSFAIQNMVIHLGDYYQRAVGEPWWPEYLASVSN